MDEDIPLHTIHTWLISLAIVRNKPWLVKRLLGRNTACPVENLKLLYLPEGIVKIVWPEGSEICDGYSPDIRLAIMRCIVSMDPELWRERDHKAVELLERQEVKFGRGVDKDIKARIGSLDTLD